MVHTESVCSEKFGVCGVLITSADLRSGNQLHNHQSSTLWQSQSPLSNASASWCMMHHRFTSHHLRHAAISQEVSGPKNVAGNFHISIGVSMGALTTVQLCIELWKRPVLTDRGYQLMQHDQLILLLLARSYLRAWHRRESAAIELFLDLTNFQCGV